MKQIFLLPTIIALFILPSFGQQKSKLFLAKDKAQIIKFILLDFDLLNRGLSINEKKEVVFLSTENISLKLIPKIQGLKFVLFTPQEIERKERTGFGYYTFGQFRSEGTSILVGFGYVFHNIGAETSYSNKIEYEFKKEKGVWKGKVINASGSIS